MDEYYTFDPLDGGRFAEVFSPVDSEEAPLAIWTPITNPGPYTSTCRGRRTRLGDFVKCVGTALMVSERAMLLFRKAVVPEGTAFVPVRVLTDEGHDLGNLYAICFPVMLDVVDMAASKYELLTEEIIWRFLEPPVLKASQLKGLDLLQGRHLPRICSGRLKREIEREELTNFKFSRTVVF